MVSFELCFSQSEQVFAIDLIALKDGIQAINLLQTTLIDPILHICFSPGIDVRLFRQHTSDRIV